MGEVIDDIKIEVELPPTEGDNLLVNTSGQYGAWQWSNDNLTTDVSIVGDPVARTIKATRGATAGSTGIWTDHVPVTPGRYANARIDLLAVTAGHKVTLGMQFYDATDGVLTWQYSSPSTTLDTLAFSSVLVPANAVSVRLFIVLDKTADPNPDTGSANPGASFTFTRAMIAELTTAGVPSIVNTNLMPNGGFQHVTTGWTPAQNIASISRVDTGGGLYILRARLKSGITLANGAGSYVDGPFVTGIEAGENYSLRIDIRADAMTDGHTLEPTMFYCWYNDSNEIVTSCTFVDSGVTNGSWVQFWRIITAPPGATKLRIHPGMRHRGPSILMGDGWDFDVDSVSVVKSSVLMPYWDGDKPDTSSYIYAWTGTVGNSPSTRTSVGAVDYNEPDEAYLRIDAGALGGKIERSELDVSTLQLQLFDAALSPAAADSVIAPGRGIRVWALDDATMTWVRKFTGEIGPCVVEYDPIEDERNGAPNITLSAVGSESILAQSSRPDVTRTPEDLTTLALAGAGVPWEVDGNTGTVSGAGSIATIEDATALDQVALTRDTVSGFAWVDADGKLWFESTLGAKSTGPATMGPDDYMGEGLSVSFSTERLINSVTIKRIIRATDGSTEERTHGPYEDLDSIRRWGRRSQTVTIASVPDDTAQADTAAAAILAANATPQIVAESVQINSGDDRTHAFHDLYDLVTVDVDTIDGAISQSSRIVSIVDEFAAEREGGRSGTWYTAYGFMADGGVASPSIQPAPSSTSEAGEWTTLPGSTGAGMTLGTKQYRVTAAGVQVRFAGTLTGAISVPASGNIGDIAVGVLPEGARPGGGGISAVAPFPINIGGVIAHAYIYNGGSIAIANAEAQGVAYNLGTSGTTVEGISPIYSVNS